MNNLETMLEEAVKNPDARGPFMNELIKSNVFVIGVEQDAKDSEGKDTKTINLVTVNNKDGYKCVPFFTSIARLEMFASKLAQGTPPHIEVKCFDFLKSVRETGAVLNPNSEFSKFFSPRELQTMFQNVVAEEQTTLHQGDEVRIGIPKVFPQELATKVCEVFEEKGNVSKAFLFQISYGRVTPHRLIVVEFEGEKEELFKAIGQAVQPMLTGPGDRVDILPSTEEFVQQFLDKGTPFYDKAAGIFAKPTEATPEMVAMAEEQNRAAEQAKKEQEAQAEGGETEKTEG